VVSLSSDLAKKLSLSILCHHTKR